MADLKLTFACATYDRMVPLRTGDVKPDGIDLEFKAIEQARDIFDRMGWNAEFDLSEFSSTEYISRIARGDRTFVALPVFPSRVFRHSFIFVNCNRIAEPKDLEGRRIGVALYTQTAALWIRGVLTSEYGVDLSGVVWVQGAVQVAGAHGAPRGGRCRPAGGRCRIPAVFAGRPRSSSPWSRPATAPCEWSAAPNG